LKLLNKFRAMLTASQLQFFKERIIDIQSALFFNLSNAVLKLPNRIISIGHVDPVAQLWFFVNRPKQHISEFDREFPARLHFLRKGKSYFIKIEGRACLITDPEEINALVDFTEEEKEKARKEQVLVKVKIHHIEYAEKADERNSVAEFIRSLSFNLIPRRRSAYRLYHLEPDTYSF